MQAIKLPWKEFKVDNTKVDAQIRLIAGDNFSGVQFGDTLELWFIETPTEEVEQACRTYWENLTSADPEATSYVPYEKTKLISEIEDKANKDIIALREQAFNEKTDETTDLAKAAFSMYGMIEYLWSKLDTSDASEEVLASKSTIDGVFKPLWTTIAQRRAQRDADVQNVLNS